MTRRDQRNYCIKKVKRGQRRSWKADRTQKQSQADEEWNKEGQTYWIRRYSTWSFGGSHGAAWMKADKETCGKKIQTQLKKKNKNLQSFSTQIQKTHTTMMKNRNLSQKATPTDSTKEKVSKPPNFFETNSGDLDVHENIFSNMDTSKKCI